MRLPRSLVKKKEKSTKQQKRKQINIQTKHTWFQKLSIIYRRPNQPEIPSVSKPDKRLWTETPGASLVPSYPWRAAELEVARCARKSLITMTGTRFVSPQKLAPPPNPCFRQNRWALKSGSSPCYLRSSVVLIGKMRSSATSVSDPISIRIAVGELFCGSQPTATTCLR